MEELEKKLSKSCEVDSQLIFKSIENANTMQEAVQVLDGDFALSFVKDDMWILNLCREENRPLHACYIPELKTLFYASEEDFLEKALISVNIKSEIWSLATNRLYSFDIFAFDSSGTHCKKVDFEYESTSYVYTSIIRPNGYTHWNHYNGNYSSTNSNSQYYDSFSGDPIRDVEEAGLSKEEIFPIEDRYISRRWIRDNLEGTWYWQTDNNELIDSRALSDEHWREINNYYENEFLQEDYWVDDSGTAHYTDENGTIHEDIIVENGVVLEDDDKTIGGI